MNAWVAGIISMTIIALLAWLVWRPRTGAGRAIVCAISLGCAFWVGRDLHRATEHQHLQATDLDRQRDNLCSRLGFRLHLDLEHPLLEDDPRRCDRQSWCGEQLRGHGAIRVIGPVLRYCVRDAASCDATIQALLDGQRPEAPFSTAPTYRAHLKVLADAFENREGCRP